MAQVRDIKARISLDGESAFRKALSMSNNSLKAMREELKTVTSEFNQNDDAVEKTAKAQEILRKMQEQSEQKIQALSDAVEYQSNESGAQLVGSYLFKPRGSDESRMIFYSNNNEKATDFEYTSEYNLDGKDCKNTVSYSFGENDCVIAISNPLQNEEAVKSASLKKGAKIIYSY